jgi:hypothetical protein
VLLTMPASGALARRFPAPLLVLKLY